MELRQLPAAKASSLALNSTCMSFSASAKVVGDTSGPTAGAVPKAGGAPGGSSEGCWLCPYDATAAPKSARGAWVKNCLRDFDMFLLKRMVAGCQTRRALDWQDTPPDKRPKSRRVLPRIVNGRAGCRGC